jgi:restriction system protein
LKQLRSVHWIKFEDIVIELLTAMGYGDGKVTQRSNDEGLDGIIKEDKLGLDNIYVQAKRYSATN